MRHRLAKTAMVVPAPGAPGAAGHAAAEKQPERRSAALYVVETGRHSMQTQSVGSRLRRGAVTRRHGVTEVCQNERGQNERDDALWPAAAQRRGDRPKVRQRRTGSG